MPVCPKGIRTHYIFKYIPLSSPQPFSHHRHTPKTLPNATRTSLHTLIQHHSSSHIQGHTHVPLMWKDLRIQKPTPWTTNKGCGLDFSSAQPARPAPSGRRLPTLSQLLFCSFIQKHTGLDDVPTWMWNIPT